MGCEQKVSYNDNLTYLEQNEWKRATEICGWAFSIFTRFGAHMTSLVIQLEGR